MGVFPTEKETSKSNAYLDNSKYIKSDQKTENSVKMILESSTAYRNNYVSKPEKVVREI